MEEKRASVVRVKEGKRKERAAERARRREGERNGKTRKRRTIRAQQMASAGEVSVEIVRFREKTKQVSDP